MKKALGRTTLIPPELYVERKADRDLRRIVASMASPGYVLVARQMGKTNLLINMKRKQEEAGEIVAYLDLSNRFVSPREFFRHVIDTIIDAGPEVFSRTSNRIRALRVRASSDVEPITEYDDHLHRLLKAATDRRVIVVFDEVDSLLSVDYSDMVFAQIRSMYFLRDNKNRSEYRRLTYVLSGVADPLDLIEDRSRSPFNIGEKILLGDFSRAEVSKLVKKAGLKLSAGVVDEIFRWTAGNPRMTWDVCSTLEDRILAGRKVGAADVSKAVKKLYFPRFDRPPVDHIRVLVENDPELLSAIIGMERRSDDALSHRSKNKLYLAGIISDVSKVRPSIKNRIIKAALSGAWLKHLIDPLTRYRASRIAEWSDDRYGVSDKLFTQLSLLLDRRQDADERWTRQKEKYKSIGQILKEQPTYPALVLLGEPGSGKSTLLRRLDLDMATGRSGAALVNAKFSYFVSLRDYRDAPDGTPPDPKKWLGDKWAADWKSKLPELPDLYDLLRDESYLLLDALNEMPLGTVGYRQRVDRWADFIAQAKAEFPKCRMVFSCRSLDYSASLSRTAIRVPHVEIERLDEDTIEQFLHHYAPENADRLFSAIKNTGQVQLYATAYFLRILGDHAGRTGEIPQDRSALFTAYVRELLHREIKRQNPLLVETRLLEKSDLARLAQPDWRSPYELPDKGPLLKQLAKLAHSMQEKSAEAGESQVVVTYDDVVEMLAPLPPAVIRQMISAGSDLWILLHDIERNRIQFVHQLMQEYFAARHLAIAPDQNLVRTAWLRLEAAPSLEQTLAVLDVNEPLPMLESTGWEETTLLAAPMATDREAFLAGLIDSNLPLAGRAAAQIHASGGRSKASPKRKIPPLPTSIIAGIQDRLLQRMRDPLADLRARIGAGKSLGELGHPDFTGKKSIRGRHEYLVPPVTHIPARTHQMGSNEGFHAHEGPQHLVELADFRIAQFPVTNAEWDCFLKAGGYRDERWWKTAAAKQWREGQTTRVARNAQWRAFRNMLKRNPSYIEGKLLSGELSPQAATEHYKARDLSDEEFEATLQRDFEELRKGQAHTRYTEPRRWRNKDFNNPLQPVVGISWYEAQAYCAWLSAQTGARWRLPTEAEWEAAARFGRQDHAPYPWGVKFERDNCNTFESHIRAPTPVGIFPGGDTAAGLVDISGNAYEWTSSKYDKKKFPYPYDKDDGRENPEDVEDDPQDYYPRVLRGGSWYYSKDEARIAFRLRFHPGYHNQSTGLRLVLDGE